MRISTLHLVSILLLFAIGGVKSTCEGGNEDVYQGLTKSTAIEALGIDDVERCYPGPQATTFIQDLEWRCEQRYCCNEPCNCTEHDVFTQDTPCFKTPINRNMTCLVQHLHAGFRYFKWKCCDGYVEHPDTHYCLKTCTIDNGDCQQLCQNAEEAPNQAICHCLPGYQPVSDDAKECKDVNECATANGGCSHLCSNSIGSYSCSCPEGFQFIPGSIYTCKEIPTTTDSTTTTASNSTQLPVDGAAIQQSDGGSGSTFLVIAVIGSLIFLALIILILVFVCKKKKNRTNEPFLAAAYTNDTYGDLKTRKQHKPLGAEGGGYPAEKKKLPPFGEVGVDNPGYDPGLTKKAQAMNAEDEPFYEEIPYDRYEGIPGAVANGGIYDNKLDDGYEAPVQREKRGSFIEVEPVKGGNSVDNPTYNRISAKAESAVVIPPAYSEIPTPAEVTADPRPPAYQSPKRSAAAGQFKDFQAVGLDNALNDNILEHHVDIKDINVKDSIT